jgi:SM-20-related protein
VTGAASSMSDAPMASDFPALRLNPNLNAHHYAEIFRRDGIVQVHDVFEPALADEMLRVLRQETPWQLFFSEENWHGVKLNDEQLAELGPEKVGRQWRELLQRAAKGVGFVYLVCTLSEHPRAELFKFLNSPEFMEFGKQVIGRPDVQSVDAAATWYRPGDFLTMHTDVGGGARLAAYTLGFTPGWRPDWGGQLLFHDNAGDVTRGLMPGFNVLTLFKTPRDHSVAQVASYAAVPRVSISGWLIGSPSA